MVEEVKSKFTFGAAALLFFILAIITQFVFFFLRIFHVIDWNWVWVLMPAIIVGGLLLLVVLILIFSVLLLRPGEIEKEDA